VHSYLERCTHHPCSYEIMLCPKIFCVVFFIQTRLAKKVMYIYISNELQH